MKTKLITETKSFKPITIEITLESQKEVDALAALFNFNPMCEAMFAIGGKMPDSRALFSESTNKGDTNSLADALKNTEWIRFNFSRK